jgi:hypothetical protein
LAHQRSFVVGSLAIENFVGFGELFHDLAGQLTQPAAIEFPAGHGSDP